MKALLAAIRFLTILPVPGAWGCAESDLARSVPWFPVVGLILGAVCAAAAWGMTLCMPPLLGAALLVLVMLAVSGCLHMDGAADTADAFLSARRRERMLEIMKDSHVGTMGVVAVAGVLLVKFAALSSLWASRPAAVVAVAGLMPLAGRAALVLNMACLPYVRDTGLAKVFYHKSHSVAAAWAVLVLLAAGYLLLDAAGAAMSAASAVVSLAFAAYVYRKIGGATGDTLGAACELAETAPAVVAALWYFQPVR